MPIRIEKIENIWWLINSKGERFVSLGINHFQSDCWLAPYNIDFMRDRYGDDLATEDLLFNPVGKALPKLIDATQENLRSLKFNSFGLHTYDVPHDMLADDFYYCIAIEYFPLGSRFKFDQQQFPDIFHPEFQQGLDEHLQALSLQHKTREHFIGYAFSDIPRWYFFQGQPLDDQPVHPWVQDLMRMPTDSPGHQAFLRFKAEAGLIEIKTREHSDAILSQVVNHWYHMHVDLVHKHDPGRLILGDKLHSPHRLPDWFKPLLKKYVDILLIQWYLPIEDQRETLTKLYQEIGKPILNGDSCFGYVKAPKQTKVKGYPVGSQAEVGKSYYQYLEGLMKLPFMLGWHHCGLLEQWDGGKRRDWEINENGLFDPFENPYPEITTPVQQANQSAYQWHEDSAST